MALTKAQQKLALRHKWLPSPTDPELLFRKLFRPTSIEKFNAHWGPSERHLFYYSRKEIANRVRYHRSHMRCDTNIAFDPSNLTNTGHRKPEWLKSAEWLLDYLRLRQLCKVTILTEVRFGVRTSENAAGFNPKVNLVRATTRRLLNLPKDHVFPPEQDPARPTIQALSARYDLIPRRTIPADSVPAVTHAASLRQSRLPIPP